MKQILSIPLKFLFIPAMILALPACFIWVLLVSLDEEV